MKRSDKIMMAALKESFDDLLDRVATLGATLVAMEHRLDDFEARIGRQDELLAALEADRDVLNESIAKEEAKFLTGLNNLLNYDVHSRGGINGEEE